MQAHNANERIDMSKAINAVYEGAFVGHVKVKVFAKHTDGIKYACEVTEDANVYRKGEIIHTSMLWLWNSIRYLGFSTYYEGKPNLSDLPIYEGEL